MTDRVEDLSALARRSPLSSADASELEALFAAEPEEHFWHRAGSALDEEEAASAGVDEAAARVVERLLRGRKRPLWRRYSVLLPAAAALLLASLAAAAIVSVRRVRSAGPVQNAPMLVPGVRSVPSLSTAQAAGSIEVPPSAAPPLASAFNAPASAASAPLSPAELLSAAGRARRTGNAGQAIVLLGQLQTRFPNSPEALASDISLGKLQLQSGAAASALQHFDRYLQRSAQGSLAPEALWGRAQALSALGNQAQARSTWAELAQRYPASPYASLANAKLHGSSVAPQ